MHRRQINEAALVSFEMPGSARNSGDNASGWDPLKPLGIKKMLFLPSSRLLWSVVGRDREYWVDPGSDFCSCSDYYFSSLSGGGPCYHLEAVKRAADNEMSCPEKISDCVESFEFDDTEYGLVLAALASDAEAILGSR